MSNSYFKAIHQVITKGHLITANIGKAMKEFDMSEPQFNVMRTLSEAEGKPLSMQEIQNGMVQQGSNVTRIIDKLLAKGLVNRSERPSNRRKIDIQLTAKGQNLLKILEKRVVEFHQPIMKGISNSELEELAHLLGKLRIE